MERLIEFVAKGIVTKPDEVQVDAVPSGRMVVYEISVADEDVGKMIGRQGKVIRALRTLVKASATRQGVRVDVDIV